MKERHGQTKKWSEKAEGNKRQEEKDEQGQKLCTRERGWERG
jgi:hypothetical protein